MKLTSYQMLALYIKEHGSAVPAFLVGTYWKGQKWSSQIDKRARELRARKILVSELDGKYERFRFNPLLMAQGRFYVDQDYSNVDLDQKAKVGQKTLI